MVVGIGLAGHRRFVWAGLLGAFLFDDVQNLMPVQQWVHGVWQQAMFGSGSGLLGRPIFYGQLSAERVTDGCGHAFSFKR